MYYKKEQLWNWWCAKKKVLEIFTEKLSGTNVVALKLGALSLISCFPLILFIQKYLWTIIRKTKLRQ